jgi:hypothetical protein
MRLKQLLNSLLTAILLFGIGSALTYIFSRTTTLICERGTEGQIDCVKSENILGILEMKGENISSLENAWVDEICDQEGCAYLVALKAAEGIYPLTNYTSSGVRSKEKIVDQINIFIQSSSEQNLEIETSIGIFRFIVPIMFFVPGIIITFVQVRNFLFQGKE